MTFSARVCAGQSNFETLKQVIICQMRLTTILVEEPEMCCGYARCAASLWHFNNDLEMKHFARHGKVTSVGRLSYSGGHLFILAANPKEHADKGAFRLLKRIACFPCLQLSDNYFLLQDRLPPKKKFSTSVNECKWDIQHSGAQSDSTPLHGLTSVSNCRVALKHRRLLWHVLMFDSVESLQFLPCEESSKICHRCLVVLPTAEISLGETSDRKLKMAWSLLGVAGWKQLTYRIKAAMHL